MKKRDYIYIAVIVGLLVFSGFKSCNKNPESELRTIVIEENKVDELIIDSLKTQIEVKDSLFSKMGREIDTLKTEKEYFRIRSYRYSDRNKKLKKYYDEKYNNIIPGYTSDKLDSIISGHRFKPLR